MPGAGVTQDRYRFLAAPIARRLWNIDVRGLEHLPRRGAAVLCPNHISFLDSAFLMLVAPRRISFVGKAEYMRSWKTKFVFPALGMIPIDRSGGSRSHAALDTAGRVLERGELFGIFPEGTPSRDGRLYKGHTGGSRPALQVGCPIVPVGITGTAEIQPPRRQGPEVGRFVHHSVRSATGNDPLLPGEERRNGHPPAHGRGHVRDPNDDRSNLR